MVFNPLFTIPDFFLHRFSSLWVTLGLKEMGKAKLRQPTRLTFFPTFPKEFPISFKPKVEGGHHASFPQKPVVKALDRSLG